MSSKTRKQGPVAQHRMFPAIVGLWFAALFGLGSFAVPPELLSRVIAVSGLPSVVAAAAPPLGFTAHALIALTLTGLGALVGVVIGRRFRAPAHEPVRRRTVAPTVAAPIAIDAPKIRARDSHPDAPPRKPFTASEDMAPGNALQSESQGETSPRRRTLTMTDESQLASPLDFAPVPGSRPVEPLDLETLLAEIEPLHGEEPHVEEPAAALDLEEVAPFAQIEQFAPAAELALPAATNLPAGAAAPADEPAEFMAEPVPARSPLAAVPLESLGVVQLVERLAVAIADYNDRRPDRALPQFLAAALSGSALVPHSVPAPRSTADEPAPASGTNASGLPASAPSASMVQTAAALPIKRLQATPFAPPASVPTISEIDAEIDSDIGEEADLVQTARYLGAGFAEKRTPVAVQPQPVPLGDSEPVTGEAEPLSPIAEAVEGEVFADDGYSSLLDLKPVERPTLPASTLPASTLPASTLPASTVMGDIPQPARPAATGQRQVFIRVETPTEILDTNEPVVIFPGQAARSAASDLPGGGDSPSTSVATGEAPIDPAEADRALRAALATLQRMTGSR